MKTELKIISHGVMLADYFGGTSGAWLNISLDKHSTYADIIKGLENEINLVFDHIEFTADSNNFTGDLSGAIEKEIRSIKEFLKDSNVKTKKKIIVTSSRKDFVEYILKYFDIYKYFDKVIDRFDVVRGKPDSEGYFKGMKYLGYTEDECVVFEDSFFGLQSAKGTGIFTIGILNKGWNDDFVYQLSDFVIEDYRSLIS